MSVQTHQLFDWFKKAARFDYKYPREKVYMHFDNSAYLVGDSLWYKAYVVRASSLHPTTLSKVLYVELLNADGQQVALNIHKLDSLGTANGMFSLQSPIYAGYYEVRAYTREMINWGSEACFSRILPVFTNNNPQRDLKKGVVSDIVQLSIPQPEPHNIESIINPRPYDMGNEKEALLNFFPEGGGRVAGSTQRIAYKLTDGRGMPLTSDTLNIYSSTGELYCTSVPEHEGMGTFILGGDFKTGYASLSSGRKFTTESSKQKSKSKSKSKSNSKKELALDSLNYGIQADYTSEGELLRISADKRELSAHKLLGLAVFNRDQVCYFDTLTIEDESVELLVPQKALHGGVCRAELFDTDGNGLSTRLFWVPLAQVDSQRVVKVGIEQNQEEYAPFSPIVIKLKAQNVQGQLAQNSSVSIAVREEEGNLVATHDGSFLGNLLLSSELKGFIHRPDLYFVRNDASHRHMLDLLMLVQGWQSNAFSVMCGKDTFNLRQPIEDKMIIRGTLFKDNKKKDPFAQAYLNLSAYRYENDKVLGNTIIGHTQTDDSGKFAFESNIDFEGDYIAQFNMYNDKNKRKWTRLTIDRWFSPQPRPLWSSDLLLNGYERNAMENQHESEIFEWKDTLQRTIVSTLRTAEVVTHVRKYKGFTGNRYTYGGGENYGQRQSLKFINVEKEIERIKDLGGSGYINLLDLLQYANNRIRYDRYGLINTDNLIETIDLSNTDADGYVSNFSKENMYGNIDSEFMVEGHKVLLYINNELASTTDDKIPNIPLYENVKSISFVMNKYMTDALTGEEKRFGKNSYTIFVYEEPHTYRTQNGKGKEYRHLQGFTPKVKFYSPDYRKFDLPNENDNRRTLLWNPQVQLNEKGEAAIIFYSNSHKNQTIDISVRGITPEGKLIDWN